MEEAIEKKEEVEVKELFDYSKIEYKEPEIMTENAPTGRFKTVFTNNLKILIYHNYWFVQVKHKNLTSIHFKINLHPTENCQFMAIGNFRQLLITIFEAPRFFNVDSVQIDLDITERKKMFKRVLEEIDFHYNKINLTSFKLWLIDINQKYKPFLFDSKQCNLKEDIFLTKQDYTSTNGSTMFIGLVNVIKLIKAL